MLELLGSWDYGHYVDHLNLDIPTLPMQILGV